MWVEVTSPLWPSCQTPSRTVLIRRKTWKKCTQRNTLQNVGLVLHKNCQGHKKQGKTEELSQTRGDGGDRTAKWMWHQGPTPQGLLWTLRQKDSNEKTWKIPKTFAVLSCDKCARIMWDANNGRKWVRGISNPLYCICNFSGSLKLLQEKPFIRRKSPHKTWGHLPGAQWKAEYTYRLKKKG